MKIVPFLLAFLLMGVVSRAALAQDGTHNVTHNMTMMSVEASANAPRSRTPMLVAHGVPKVEPGTPAPDAARPNGGANNAVNTSGKTLSTLKDAPTRALNPTAATSPSPIFLPGSTGPSVQGFAPATESTGNPAYDQLVHQSATRHGVDPNLIFAVMRQESGFKTRAVSYKGASGLMQLMPATARRFGVTNIFDPAQNIDAGAKYLRWLLNTFDGDVKLALAGYNAGENAVINSGYQIPRYRETQNYVKSISARYSHNKQTTAARPKPAAGAPQPLAPQAISTSKGRLSNN
jgi:soluble lytic murein transglycosylase-like protein